MKILYIRFDTIFVGVLLITELVSASVAYEAVINVAMEASLINQNRHSELVSESVAIEAGFKPTDPELNSG